MNVQHSLRAYVFVEDDEQAGTSFSVSLSLCYSASQGVSLSVCYSVCYSASLRVSLSSVYVARIYNENRIILSLLSRCAREKLEKC